MLLSKKLKITALTAAVAAFTFTSAEAYAQHAQQDTYMDPQGQAAAAEVSDQQLQNFAEAETAVREVQAEYQARAESASSPEEISTLQQQMNQEIITSIQNTGLTIEEYNTVMTAVQTDPAVREQYSQISR